MKKIFTRVLLISCLFVLAGNPGVHAQPCQEDVEIFTFTFDERTYQVVKENLRWEDAAECAHTRGGKLVEINSADEQLAVFEGVTNANIEPSATYASEYSEIAFVWLGGNDSEFEGDWWWDGDYDGAGELFWIGNTTGAAVGGSYYNWGFEPDNAGDQDGMAMALTDWPTGEAGEWADLKIINDLYYVVEYSTLLNTYEPLSQSKLVSIFPNPATQYFRVDNRSGFAIESIEILHSNGTLLKTIHQPEFVNIDISQLPKGAYITKLQLESGSMVVERLLIL